MRALNIAYVRFKAPDLREMDRFLRDFGLETFESDGRLYGLGLDQAPFIHVTEVGEPGFVSLGLRAESVAELADREGVELVSFDAPGGGSMVVLTDPDGYRVEVVAGQEAHAPRALPGGIGWNDAREKNRLGLAKRTGANPSHVVRLGHCVLGVSDFRASEAWYKERFGFITSDEITVSDEFSLGAFMRCDRGDEPTDHHSLFLLQGPTGATFNHAAFEVVDLDDLFVGHEQLHRAGWKPYWGVGRHVLGSQVFDYWRDPWGHTLEHYTDGDLLTAKDGSRKAPVSELLAVQWGHAAPHAN